VRVKAGILEPRDEGIVLWSLRFGDELRPEGAYLENIDDEADPDIVPLVQQLIKKKTKRPSPDMVSYPIQESLLKPIRGEEEGSEAEKEGREGKRRPGLQRHQHHGRLAEERRRRTQKQEGWMMSNDGETQLCEPAPFLYFENGQIAVTDGASVWRVVVTCEPIKATAFPTEMSLRRLVRFAEYYLDLAAAAIRGAKTSTARPG
jgi:hypothetical protein